MILPPLPTDDELRTLEKFPYLEGHQFEYKQSLAPSKFQKMDETICAFLNSGGGYFIVGVEDLTLKMLWLEYTCKEIDKILLRVDDIFHRRTVHCDDGAAIDPSCVKARIVTKIVDDTKRYLVIVTAIPTEGKLYKCNDRVWYRLNASNFGLSDEKMYPAGHVYTMVNQAIHRTQTCYTTFIQTQMKHIAKMEKRMAVAQTKDAPAMKLLETKILMEKMAAEAQLRQEKQISWVQFLCCLF
jgi:hypothetical protein